MESQAEISKKPYPKPGQEGGRLIRRVICFLRQRGWEGSKYSHILIAVSGGCDSVALAHLLVNYGRNIVPREKVKLLHVNHNWRPGESDLDEAFVIELGARWGVPVICQHLEGPAAYAGQSWEAEARKARKAIFSKLAHNENAQVFTAHQGDDLAETLLWRLFTGAAETHGGGISFQHGVEVRPLLKVRKKEILGYLEEEKQSYREDSTNSSQRFLRARMRSILMPEVERLFPRGISHLIASGLQAQSRQEFNTEQAPYGILFQAAGLRPNRSHLKDIAQGRSVQLPGGWRLTCEKVRAESDNLLKSGIEARNEVNAVSSDLSSNSVSERWVLELI